MQNCNKTITIFEFILKLEVLFFFFLAMANYKSKSLQSEAGWGNRALPVSFPSHHLFTTICHSNYCPGEENEQVW